MRLIWSMHFSSDCSAHTILYSMYPAFLFFTMSAIFSFCLLTKLHAFFCVAFLLNEVHHIG